MTVHPPWLLGGTRSGGGDPFLRADSNVLTTSNRACFLALPTQEKWVSLEDAKHKVGDVAPPKQTTRFSLTVASFPESSLLSLHIQKSLFQDLSITK